MVDNMNALFDLLTKSELALELDAAVLELDAHAAKITAQAREIEALRGALEALKHEDGCYCDAAFAPAGTIVMHSPECIAARAVLAQKKGTK
jgi:hypothetical protein